MSTPGSASGPSAPAVSSVDHPGGIRVVTVCNAAKRNALDPALLAALAEVFSPERSGEVRAVLLRGEGEKAFCAGFDLSALEAGRAEGGSGAAGSPPPDSAVGTLMARIEAFPAPVVALIHGGAFGAGCELALACDFRVGAEDAVLCMPPAKLGVVYAPDGLQRVLALVGPARAKRIFLTGDRLDARTCAAWGLLDEVRPKPEAEAAALRLCGSLAANAPLAVRGMKRALNLLSRPQLTAAERSELEGLRREAFASEDVREGAAAFREKRAPRFSGR